MSSRQVSRESYRDSRDSSREEDRRASSYNSRSNSSHNNSQRNHRDDKYSRREREYYRQDDSNQKRRRDSPSRNSRNSPGRESKKQKPEEVVSTEVVNPVDFRKRVEEQLSVITQESNVDKLADERRRKREAILAKYKAVEELQPAEQTEVEKDKETSSPEPLGSPEKEDTEKLVVANGESANEHIAITTAEPVATSKIEEEDDMFSDSPTNRANDQNGSPTAAFIPQHANIETDADGYVGYLPPGTILNERYQIICSLGSGVFSKVFKALDKELNKEVAIKIIRQNDLMKQLGAKEVKILELLSSADPADKFNCARLITHFEDRQYLCLVFEIEVEDLLQVIKAHGKVGLSIKAVQVYAKQLFLALYHLKKNGIIHADLKPTNILVNKQRTKLRVSDLGSALYLQEASVGQFLVTGWYRPPEIILGCAPTHAVDLWSGACTVFEIATGKVLFPGGSQNEMIKLQLAVKGKDSISKKMLKKTQYAGDYFDENLNFLEARADPISGKEYTFAVAVNEPTRDLKAELLKGQSKEDYKKVFELHDLLMKCLALDPSRRITIEEALVHPFFSNNV